MSDSIAAGEHLATKVKSFLEGDVVSTKMNKTVVVSIVRTFRHPLLGKIVKRSKKYKVHDEAGLAQCGDIVEIESCRPISKTKHMKLIRVIKAAASK